MRVAECTAEPASASDGGARCARDVATRLLRARNEILQISVVIPAHNSAHFIGEALASVRAQTYPAEEVIVVDDASTDATAEVATAQGARVIRLSQNVGPSAARNRGVAEATGDAIAFLDADDSWQPEHCAVLAQLLEGIPEAALAFSCARPFWEQDGKLHEGSAYFDLPAEKASDALPALLRRNFIGPTSVLMRRTCYEAIGGFDGEMRYSEDYDLWLRIAIHWRVIGSPRMTSRRRLHSRQASHLGRLQLVQGAWVARFRARDQALSHTGVIRDPAEINRALRTAWWWDWRLAWEERTRDVADFLAGQIAHQVLSPGSAFWARQSLRTMWGPWLLARRLARAMHSRPRLTPEFPIG